MKLLTSIMICFFILILGIECYSLPRFSLRAKNKCIDCHYNPTGGLIRNENGFFYGQNLLSMISPRTDEFTMSPKLNNNISIGLDFRGQFLYSQSKNRTDFQDMSGSIYANIQIAKNIDIISRYDFVQDIWEGYGVGHIFPNNGYVKGGAFQPYYGLRIDDHTAYTRGGDFSTFFATGARSGLIYNPLYVEAGIEFGFYISNFVFLTTSVGTNLNNPTLTKDPTYTARLEFDPIIGNVALMFGGSYAAAKVPQPTDFYGGFAGIGYDRFTLLAEFDHSNNLIGTNIKSNFLTAQAAYVIIIGLEAIVRYDWMDPNIDISNDEIGHLVLGLEFVPYSFVEIRPQYRFIIEDPNIDNDAVVIQFHLYY